MNESAIYTITLEISGDECQEDTPLVDESIEGLSGRLQWRSASQDWLNEAIDQDDFEDNGGTVLSIDEFMNDIQANTGIIWLVTEDSLVENGTLEGEPFEDDTYWFDTQPVENEGLTGWATVGIIICVSFVIFFVVPITLCLCKVCESRKKDTDY